MIKRYFATKDNTITNAYRKDMVTRATGSNMGQSDVLEIFSIYGQLSGSSGLSSEKSRCLMQFDTSKITSDRNAGKIPESGNVTWYLRMFNAKHSQTLPSDFSLEIQAVSASWEEGQGLDMEGYTDLTYNVVGSNWINSNAGITWKDPTGGPAYSTAIEGGAFHTSPVFYASFGEGTEDLEKDITTLVEQWLDGTKSNYGIGIKLSGELESSGRSYYTKKFFARSTEYFFSRPVLEARWDSSIRDDRGNTYVSSSLAPASDNLNTIYLYNYVKGRLSDIPEIANGEIIVSLYPSPAGAGMGLGLGPISLPVDGTHVKSTNAYAITGGWVSTGIYSASFALYTEKTSGLETVRDVWFKGLNTVVSASQVSETEQYHTGTISLKRFESATATSTNKYVLSVSNRNNTYYYDQTHRLRIYARQKKWSPNIYTTATTIPDSIIFESASYQVYRVVDDRVVIPYSTGSINGTRLSYDVSGNYFDLDASILEPNYTYGLKLSIYDTDTLTYEEQPFTYKFRVTKNEY
jgi:hypothetical protein